MKRVLSWLIGDETEISLLPEIWKLIWSLTHLLKIHSEWRLIIDRMRDQNMYIYPEFVPFELMIQTKPRVSWTMIKEVNSIQWHGNRIAAICFESQIVQSGGEDMRLFIYPNSKFIFYQDDTDNGDYHKQQNKRIMESVGTWLGTIDMSYNRKMMRLLE